MPVTMYAGSAIPPKRPTKDGDGFKGFAIVDEWEPHMKWAREGLIFITGNYKFLPQLDRYRDLGYKIFGPTAQSAKLEINRAFGMEAMQKAGIEVPPYKTFDSLKSAEAFARKSDLAWVFKTMGDEEDKSLSYVSKDPADLVGWLERKQAQGTKLKGQCMLQEKIDMECELGVSGWFGPGGFLADKWQICVEHKKLMNGEVGPNTGEQGTITQYVKSDKLAQEFLIPMSDTLKRLRHRGDFALGAGIDKSGKAWPFEFTGRAGWPAFYLQVASHKGDPAQWMRDLLDGKDTLKVSEDICIGVVCSQPRYPYNDSPPEMVEGNPISGIEDAGDAVHMASVMIANGPSLRGGKVVEEMTHQTTGEYVLVATALGKTVERARKKVYAAVDKISFPDMMYRSDIGEKIEGSLGRLHGWGYATEMTYQ